MTGREMDSFQSSNDIGRNLKMMKYAAALALKGLCSCNVLFSQNETDFVVIAYVPISHAS